MKYKYTRKEIVKMIKTKCFFGHNESKAVRWLLATQPKTQPTKEDKKECKHKFSSKDCRCFYCGKEITSGTIGNSTPSPLELPKINNNFSSMEQYNWAKQITDEVNKLYQLIKEKQK